VLALALVAAGAAAAQNPPPGQPPQDSMLPPMARMGFRRQVPGQRAEQLRMQIEQRFAQRVQTELGLNDQQMDRLRTAERNSRDRHRALQDREQDLRRAVGEQLRPGVAANSDSLSRLLDAIAANHVARAQEEQQELRELAQFLTPVQRARLLTMRQMLMQRVQAIREGRWSPPMGRPGFPGGPPE
jgi:predicted phage gp36 major capsid-like protein